MLLAVEAVRAKKCKMGCYLSDSILFTSGHLPTTEYRIKLTEPRLFFFAADVVNQLETVSG